MPVYYVIVDPLTLPNSIYPYQILEVIACTIDDVTSGRVNVQKYHEKGQYRATGLIFVREPDNPFREEVKKHAS